MPSSLIFYSTIKMMYKIDILGIEIMQGLRRNLQGSFFSPMTGKCVTMIMQALREPQQQGGQNQ